MRRTALAREALEGAQVVVIDHGAAAASAAIITQGSRLRIVGLSGYADLRNAASAGHKGICR